MSDTVPLPPLAPIESQSPLPEETFEALWRTVQFANERLLKQREPHRASEHAWRRAEPISETRCRMAFRAMQGDFPLRAATMPLFVDARVVAELGKFAERAEVTLLPLVRLCRLTGWLDNGSTFWNSIRYPTELLVQHFRRTHPTFGLRELAAAFEAVGVCGDWIGHARLDEYAAAFVWENAAVWPYFAERWELLERRIRGAATGKARDRSAGGGRKNALDVLRGFPAIPASLADALWDLSLGNAKPDRLAAQAILESNTGWQERVAAALADGQFSRRAAAADWLGRRGDATTLEPLRQALRKEKQEAAKAALMDALERRGASIDEFLDRGALVAEAAKTRHKGTPAALAWFPFDQLPAVHWIDNGEPVGSDILRHFLLQSFRLKNPEPSPLLRRYCRMFVPAERERLGDFIFQRWLDRDLVRKYTDEEARRLAKNHAAQLLGANVTLPDLEKGLFEQYRREVGSAIQEKGILAVAAACWGRQTVQQIEAYLKQWYGYRAPHCKALVAMLASIEHPAAVQLLLSTANRFRTKSIRLEAERQVRLLAQRKDWTLGQLADRTIPTAGLDATARLVLDYGSRRFVAALDDRLTVALTNEEGKRLTSLPAPGKKDDEEQARHAKRQFASLKKEVKQIVKQQTERLYESMCAERVWRFDEWDEHLHRHPVVRRLCRRLVWAVVEGGAVQQTFRPLEDGTLTDDHDNLVTLAPEATVQLAHRVLVSPAMAESWLAHFADYEVAPLFSQFGRGAFQAPDARKQDTEIRDFEGCLIEAFTLRGMATKAGYLRGETQDGGWFCEYYKPFPNLGLQATLEFSGNALPETNRTVALVKLSFSQMLSPTDGSRSHTPSRVALGETPRVLVSECYQDFRSLAASGPGYHADWEQLIGRSGELPR